MSKVKENTEMVSISKEEYDRLNKVTNDAKESMDKLRFYLGAKFNLTKYDETLKKKVVDVSQFPEDWKDAKYYALKSAFHKAVDTLRKEFNFDLDRFTTSNK